MCEVLRVKLGEAAAVIDGLTYDKHGGEREVVGVNNHGSAATMGSNS